MTEPGVLRRALYRSERVGRRRDGGVEAFAMESWKSVCFCFVVLAEDGLVSMDWSGVGVTTNSRHCGSSAPLDDLGLGIGPVGVAMTLAVSFESGAMD